MFPSPLLICKAELEKFQGPEYKFTELRIRFSGDEKLSDTEKNEIWEYGQKIYEQKFSKHGEEFEYTFDESDDLSQFNH